MTALPQETVQTLEQLNSAIRFSHTEPPRCRVGEEVKCEVIDRLTGKTYATAVSNCEPSAAVLAVEAAVGAQKPMTPAQMATENRQLTETVADQAAELERLRAGQADGPAPPQDDGQDDAEAEQSQEPPTPATPVAAAQGPGNNSADLVAQLDARNLTLPPGDRRTSAWREAAAALLEYDAEVTGAA